MIPMTGVKFRFTCGESSLRQGVVQSENIMSRIANHFFWLALKVSTEKIWISKVVYLVSRSQKKVAQRNLSWSLTRPPGTLKYATEKLKYFCEYSFVIILDVNNSFPLLITKLKKLHTAQPAKKNKVSSFLKLFRPYYSHISG